eukprot:3142785-Rhodomonas_salina.1
MRARGCAGEQPVQPTAAVAVGHGRHLHAHHPAPVPQPRDDPLRSLRGRAGLLCPLHLLLHRRRSASVRS